MCVGDINKSYPRKLLDNKPKSFDMDVNQKQKFTIKVIKAYSALVSKILIRYKSNVIS